MKVSLFLSVYKNAFLDFKPYDFVLTEPLQNIDFQLIRLCCI